MQSTSRAFRWLCDSGLEEMEVQLSKVQEYCTQLSGLKKTMTDCVVQIVSRIRLTENHGNDHHRCKFQRKLEAISDSWEHDCQNSHSRVIDLTNHSPVLQGPFFET